MNAELFVNAMVLAIERAARNPDIGARHAEVERIVKEAYHDAMQVTVGRVVTLLWGVAKKAPIDEAAVVKKVAGLIASSDMQ